jgi:hypothetical protein
VKESAEQVVKADPPRHCTNTSLALGVKRGGNPGGADNVDSNACRAREVERNYRGEGFLLDWHAFVLQAAGGAPQAGLTRAINETPESPCRGAEHIAQASAYMIAICSLHSAWSGQALLRLRKGKPRRGKISGNPGDEKPFLKMAGAIAGTAHIEVTIDEKSIDRENASRLLRMMAERLLECIGRPTKPANLLCLLDRGSGDDLGTEQFRAIT